MIPSSVAASRWASAAPPELALRKERLVSLPSTCKSIWPRNPTTLTFQLECPVDATQAEAVCHPGGCG
eukprot:2425386-Lingulodinium_polyedra.AAC.1